MVLFGQAVARVQTYSDEHGLARFHLAATALT
jgi:hypothetical protein